MPPLTRRRRLILVTAGAGMLFVVGAGAIAWRWSQPGAAYAPGEAIDGITAGLARDIPPDHPRVVFTDVSRAAGIDFVHFAGTRTSQLPEDMGSGAAWGDYDNDGWQDLVIANETGPLTGRGSEAAAPGARARLTLYRNNGDGTFSDVTDAAGLDLRGWLMGVAWGDYDNDGRLDLVVTSYGTNHLFHNDGNGVFSDRSRTSRLTGPVGFWTGASWGDYDRDGDLDLYVTGYVRFTRHPGAHFTGKYDVENPASINPSSFPPERNLLYRNEGNGTFSEVARAAGVTDTLGRGLSAAWVDLDEDGWPDLYVANDVSDNVLYRNLGNGRFADVSHAARVADYRSAMGIAVGDWDRDGDQDLFLTHWLAQENALYGNQRTQRAAAAPAGPPMLFMDEADRFGLGQSSLDFVGWATSFVDYDNDGWLDLFVVNGSTLQVRGDSTRLVPMRNQLFWNRGAGAGFVDVAPVAGAPLRESRVGRGGAFADYDNDGDVDVLIVNHGARAQLLRNDGGNRNRWLAVEVRGTKSNRQGIGATITVVAGGRRDARQVGAQSSYLSQNSLVEVFGLGPLERADTVYVRWPSGARDVVTGAAAQQRITITEGRGTGTDRARVQAFWQRYREATALRTAGDTVGAAVAYERALALDPDHEDVLYYAGSLRLTRGDFAGAADAWRRLARVNPSSARAHSQLARLYLCTEAGAPFNVDSARLHIQRAHAINREESGPLLRLGEVALFAGDQAAARRHFEAVVVSNPASEVAHFFLGYLAWKGGDAAGARAHLERVRSSAAAGRRSGPVAGEGDTKRGAAPLTVSGARCDQLRTIAAAGADMDSAYARVKRLLTPPAGMPRDAGRSTSQPAPPGRARPAPAPPRTPWGAQPPGPPPGG